MEDISEVETPASIIRRKSSTKISPKTSEGEIILKTRNKSKKSLGKVKITKKKTPQIEDPNDFSQATVNIPKKSKSIQRKLDPKTDLNILKKNSGNTTKRIKNSGDSALRKKLKSGQLPIVRNSGTGTRKKNSNHSFEINDNTSNYQNQFSAINMPQPIFVITKNINLRSANNRRRKKKRKE